jgi:hypothetical protein
MAIATAWFIATQIGNLLICQPIDSFWNRAKPGKCLNFNIMFLATGIIDTLIDLMILLLPVRIAFTLQLPTKTKIAVAGIFALGGFVVITNIIRISYIYQPNEKYGKRNSTTRAEYITYSLQSRLHKHNAGRIYTWLPHLPALAYPYTNRYGPQSQPQWEISSAAMPAHSVPFSDPARTTQRTNLIFKWGSWRGILQAHPCVPRKGIWSKATLILIFTSRCAQRSRLRVTARVTESHYMCREAILHPRETLTFSKCNFGECSYSKIV